VDNQKSVIDAQEYAIDYFSLRKYIFKSKPKMNVTIVPKKDQRHQLNVFSSIEHTMKERLDSADFENNIVVSRMYKIHNAKRCTLVNNLLAQKDLTNF
jgi:hypothetical protein